MHNEELNDL